MSPYVYTCFMFIHVYFLFLVYIHVCQGMYSWWSVYRWLHTVYQIYRHCWTVYAHLCILLGAAFLFALLAGLEAGFGCCQVSLLFKFKHTSWISISLSSLLLSTLCPRLLDSAGGRCRSCRRLPPAAGARRSSAADTCRGSSTSVPLLYTVGQVYKLSLTLGGPARATDTIWLQNV